MIYYAVISQDGHSLVQTGSCPEDILDLQGGDLLAVECPEDVKDTTHYYWDGGFVPYPEKPSIHHTFDFDNEQWVDGWNIGLWNEELKAKREAAALSRLDFVIKCHDFMILDDEEAESAIEGGFPSAMQNIVDLMPVSERFEARMRWKGATVIDRLNPLIVNMAAQIHIDEWSLDRVFGIEWPKPLASWPDGQLIPVWTGE